MRIHRNLDRTSHHRGMTLFELAVVFTIAVILVVLAVVSMQSLITRTKTSRVKEDHRALTRAIQNYIMDYSVLPDTRQGLDPLTHPTAYLGVLPHDPFQNDSGGYLYVVPGTKDIASVLISPGPDGDFDLPEQLWQYASTHEIRKELIPMQTVRFGKSDGPAQANLSFNGTRVMSETDTAVLSTYLKLGRYDPEKGDDGDIITVIRY